MPKDETSDRYAALTTYLNNQTEEEWQRLMLKIATSLGGITVTLVDQNPTDETSRRKVKVRLTGDSHYVYVQPEGYGDNRSERGKGCPLKLTLGQDGLIVQVWADISDPESHDIWLEDAREDQRVA
jgi:hypothetical protein